LLPYPTPFRSRLGPSGRPHPPRRRRRGCGGGRRWANVTSTADVVIIGGGVTGASLAFHLTGLGVGRVLVLERRFLAAGGTGHSVGIIRQLYPTPETSAMVLLSLRVFQRFRDVVGSEAGYVGCGALIGVSPAMRPKLETTLAVQRALGIRAELLEPDDVARVEPRLDPARRGGIERPVGIGRRPGFVVERDPAFGGPHRAHLAVAGGGSVRPETGILALTGSLTDDEAEHPMDPDLLGGEAGFEEASTILERTGRAVPRLADARYRRGYAGAFDITPDWMPILDESPVRGFFIAAGLSGRGLRDGPAGSLSGVPLAWRSGPEFTGTP